MGEPNGVELRRDREGEEGKGTGHQEETESEGGTAEEEEEVEEEEELLLDIAYLITAESLKNSGGASLG